MASRASIIYGLFLAALPLSFVCARVSVAGAPTGEIKPGITTQPVQHVGPAADASTHTFLAQTGRHYIPMPDQEGGCNSDAWYPIPGYPDLFAGRYIESNQCISDGSVPNGLMTLGLAKMSVAGMSAAQTGREIDGFTWVKKPLFSYTQSASVLSGDGNFYTVPAQTIQDGYVIYTAYDPSVISYDGEVWVAFECAYVGAHAADSCMGPLITHGDTGAHWYVDPTRTTVVVSDGSANPYDVYAHAASVPKLVVFHGSVYLYYSSGRFGSDGGIDIKVRGVKLWQVAGSTGQVFRVDGTYQPAFAYDDSTSVEVMGVDPGDPLSNRVADAFGAYTDGTYIYLTGAVGGGSGCTNPGGTAPGCYRLSISRTTNPLTYHSFNFFRVPDSLLPVNPQEYTRQLMVPRESIAASPLTVPGGSSVPLWDSYFMGNYFESLPGYNTNNAIPPSTTSVRGMYIYPANFATMDFEPTIMSTLSNQSWFGHYFDPFKLVAGQNATEGDLTLSMQTDGNLVLYHDGVAEWASGTHNWPSTCTTCYASFQADGNLVLYRANGKGEYSSYWSTETNGHPGAQLHLSDWAPYLSIVQGVEIYPAKNSGPSHFAPFNLLAGQSFIIGDLTLSMRSDGNLVVYRDGVSQWASGTDNWPSTCTTCYASFQSDGNLVLYSSSGNGEFTPYWSTETNGHPGAQLVLSDAVPYLSIVLKSTQLWP